MPNQEPRILVDLRPDLPREQNLATAPIVVHRQLPLMPQTLTAQPAPQTSGKPLMGEGAPEIPTVQARMPEVPRVREAASKSLPSKPQEPRRPAVQTAPQEGYIRFHLHSERGQLSITGVHEVQGPLDVPNAVVRGYAYEATLDDQRIALGSIPDANVIRSFANRDVPGREGKHGFGTRPSFDFFVRMPKKELSAASLPRINAVLHQVHEAPERLLTTNPMGRQPGVVTKEVSRLSGIRLEELPTELRTQIERILGG